MDFSAREQPDGKVAASHPLAHEHASLPSTPEVKEPVWERAVLAAARQDDRSTSREGDLTSMRVPAERQVELIGRRVLQAHRGMHEQQSRTIGPLESQLRIRLPCRRIIQPAQPDALERGW